MDKNELLIKLIGFLSNSTELYNVDCYNPHVLKTFKRCLDYCSAASAETGQEILFCIDSVLDYLHDELNTGHWSAVSLKLRQNFSAASLVKAILVLKFSESASADKLRECLKILDLGLLLGAPVNSNFDTLSECVALLRNKLNQIEPVENKLDNVRTKRKHSNCRFNDLPGKVIDAVQVPSIETFSKSYFIPQIPVILEDCMAHWPASTKWVDVNYLLKVAGERTVPIEIGARYTDENWSQKLMTLKEFIKRFYLSNTGDIGYLAQHNLFDQIPELKEDIRVPEYCCCSFNYEDTSVDINAWLGPQGTVSPLHQDPKNNILAQVYGSKQLLLFPPEDERCLYPYEDKMFSNTAQIDPVQPDYIKYPLLKQARMYKCVLNPGQMLFIPQKWWHHVTALEKSFSVSFWWN